MSSLRSAARIGVGLLALALTFVACAGTESFLAGGSAHAQSPAVDWHRHVYFLLESQFRSKLTVKCPQGEHVISGGFLAMGKDPQLEFFRGSFPMPDLSGWQVNVDTFNPNRSKEVIVYAACTTSTVT